MQGLNRLPQAILFDLDDTLVSFERHCKPSWLETCQAFAPLLNIDAAKLYQTISDKSSHFWKSPRRHRRGRLILLETRRRLVKKAFRNLGLKDLALAERLADYYSALQESRISLFPDAIPTLQFFQAKGLKLALVTNGNAVLQRRKIERFGLAPYFQAILIEGEIGFGKPHPQVFRLALQKLHINPEDAWFVGDNLSRDIAGAKKCGMVAIWKADPLYSSVPNQGGSSRFQSFPSKPSAILVPSVPRQTEPDFRINELNELKEIYLMLEERFCYAK